MESEPVGTEPYTVVVVVKGNITPAAVFLNILIFTVDYNYS